MKNKDFKSLLSPKSPLNLPGIIDELKFHFSVMDNVLRKLLGEIILNMYSDKKRTHHFLTFNSISEILIYNCLLSSLNLSMCKITFLKHIIC